MLFFSPSTPLCRNTTYGFFLPYSLHSLPLSSWPAISVKPRFSHSYLQFAFSSTSFSFRFAVSFYYSFSFLIVRFLIFSPSGTLFWLDVITADSCCSGNIPREIASNLNKLPKEAPTYRLCHLLIRYNHVYFV